MIFINLFGKYTGASPRPRDIVVNILTECKPILIIFRAIRSSQSVLLNSVMYNSINRPRTNNNYNFINLLIRILQKTHTYWFTTHCIV